MNMDEAYRKALDMEGRREWSRRRSGQGSFEWNMARLGGWEEDSDSPDVMDVYSDHGDGVRKLIDGLDEGEREKKIAAALSRLSCKEREFAEAVLGGKTWQDLGYTSRQGLNQRLDRIIARITQIQKSLKNDDFGNL